LTYTNNYPMVEPMARRPDDVAGAERALERLFRLTMNRKVHTRQTAVVGADVTRAGYAVLRCLDAAGELTLGEVARECSMDAAAASRQVRALEDDGLVERRATPDDGRVTVVRITRAGHNVYARIVAVRTTYMGEVLAGWSAADVATLNRLVNRLVGDLEGTRFGAPVHYMSASSS